MPRRSLTGILLLDKPAGLSSHAALHAAKTLLRAQKAGHTGSLDPLATGLLPICFGEATKISGLLLCARKAYDAVFVLGVSTQTDDAEGNIIRQRPIPLLTRQLIETVLARFKGELAQRAPLFCALKQNGERLYARARRGEYPVAPVRTVRIDALDLLAWTPSTIHVRVECSAGTYIRSLARDIGEVIGCGAHVASLRRLWAEPFSAPQMVTLKQLEDAATDGPPDQFLLPLAAGLRHLSSIFLDDSRLQRFQHGQRLYDPHFPNGQVVVCRETDQSPAGLAFVGSNGVLEPRRRFNT